MTGLSHGFSLEKTVVNIVNHKIHSFAHLLHHEDIDNSLLLIEAARTANSLDHRETVYVIKARQSCSAPPGRNGRPGTNMVTQNSCRAGNPPTSSYSDAKDSKLHDAHLFAV